MSTVSIEFHKIYTRQSRSPWDDVSRVAMLFDPITKSGMYLHIGCDGINGISVSRSLQDQMPDGLQQQYLPNQQVDIAMHIFALQIEEYVRINVDIGTFKQIFLIHPDAFFSKASSNRRRQAYENYMKNRPLQREGY